MKSSLAAAWPLAPLTLAAAGLLVLAPAPKSAPESGSSSPVADATPQTPPAPFTPPALFLASAHIVGGDEHFEVDTRTSRALVVLHGDQPERLEFTVRGSLQLLADESLATLELELESTLPNGRRAVTLQLQSKLAPSRHSQIPGLHVADLDARATLGGLPRPVALAATWLRMPGGKLRLQAVAEEFDAYDDVIAAGSAPWSRTEHASFGLILELQQVRTTR